MVEKLKKYFLILAYALICISCFLILFIFKDNLYRFGIKGLDKVAEDISVNVGFDKDIENQNIEICFDSYCIKPNKTSYGATYHTEFGEKYLVDNFRIKFSKSIDVNNLDYIYIYSGSRNYHYTKDDIKQFEKITNDDYTSLNLPKVDNYTGIFNHICVLFLSLFYCANYFIVPYILLLVSFFILFYFKDIKLSPKLIIPAIIIAALLRINHITYIPLWMDELYTKYIALDSFKSTFGDPGNPPLFFILEYIFTKIFSNSDFSLRFLPMMFGILTVPAIWLLFKDVSKNFALFASFMASINSIMIYRAQEARAYSLDVFLVIVAAYILFKCIENPNTKNIILNAIITALLVNTSYYLIMIAGGNVLWGSVFIKKDRLKFFFANFVAGLSALPYIIISFKNALSEGFNAYIPKPSAEMFNSMVQYFFLNNTIAITVILIILAGLILCFIPKVKFKNKYYPYLFYIFNFTIICATLISIHIKPMMYRGNILAIYGLFFMLVISAIYPVFEIKSKHIKASISLYTIIMSFVFFNMTYPYYERQVDNLKNYADFVYYDAKKYHKDGYEIHAILPHVVPDEREYKNFEKIDYINWHIVTMGSKAVFVKKEDYSKDSKSVIYIPLLGTEYFTNDSKDLYRIYTDVVVNAKIAD